MPGTLALQRPLRPPLMLARDTTSTSILPTRVNASWEEHLSTRLCEAVARGRTRKFNELLAEGADPNWSSPEDGRTALHIAAEKGRAAFVLSLLRAGANICATDSRGRTALTIFTQRRTLFGGRVLFCPTSASYDCFAYLQQAYRAEAAAGPQRPPCDVKFEGIAVIHPGQEIGLARMPSLASLILCSW